MKLLVLNGPNLNMLGVREPGIYGDVDYTRLIEMICQAAQQKGIEVEFFQSNPLFLQPAGRFESGGGARGGGAYFQHPPAGGIPP